MEEVTSRTVTKNLKAGVYGLTGIVQLRHMGKI